MNKLVLVAFLCFVILSVGECHWRDLTNKRGVMKRAKPRMEDVPDYLHDDVPNNRARFFHNGKLRESYDLQ